MLRRAARAVAWPWPACERFLAELLMAECDDRARRRSERRFKTAGFAREKILMSLR
ncbi:hypothetical protein ACH4VM_39540 [Streptomyces sp. NPDC020792]|uniref:hypothetical protein n=1 Tax=Streptomyces sp. NPDC020792 TaxID=3365089 RepID=UPI0037B909CD